MQPGWPSGAMGRLLTVPVALSPAWRVSDPGEMSKAGRAARAAGAARAASIPDMSRTIPAPRCVNPLNPASPNFRLRNIHVTMGRRSGGWQAGDGQKGLTSQEDVTLIACPRPHEADWPLRGDS